MESIVLRDPSGSRRRLAVASGILMVIITTIAFTWIALRLSPASSLERIGIWMLGVLPTAGVFGYWTWRNLTDGVEVHVDRLVVRTGRKRTEIRRTDVSDVWISIYPNERNRWNGAWMVKLTAASIDHWLRVLNGGHRSARHSRPDYLEHVAASLRIWVATGALPDPAG